MCCKLMGVQFPEALKVQGKWCEHCDKGRGCLIYEQRPQPCRDFECGWLQGIGVDAMRPDRSHVILVAKMGTESEGWLRDNLPILIVHVDRANPDAWRQGAMGRYLQTVVERNGVILERVKKIHCQLNGFWPEYAL